MKAGLRILTATVFAGGCYLGAYAQDDTDGKGKAESIPVETSTAEDKSVPGSVVFESFQPLSNRVYRYPEEANRAKEIENVHNIGPAQNDTPEAQDSIRALVSRFYVNQFRHFQDPMAPYFMFISKGAKMAMGLGGVIKMKGWFEWNGVIPSQNFEVYNMPMHRDPANNKQLAADPGGTGIFFTIIGTHDKVGDYMGYIEATFDGYRPNVFVLQKAFLTIRNVTFGYATSSFADPAAAPPTVDGAGAVGRADRRNILVRYLYTKKNWSVGGSFEFPTSKPRIDDPNAKKVSDYTPDIAGLVQYKWLDGISHVRLSVLLRGVPYRNLIEQKNHTIFGWGVQLSGMFKVAPPVMLYGLANIGQGHGSYISDLARGQFDLVSDPGTPGKLYAPAALGLTFGARYSITHNVHVGCALSELRYLPKHPYPTTAEYKYGLYGAVNVFWNITPRLQVGLEYDAGKRMNFDHTSGNSNRVVSMAQLSF